VRYEKDARPALRSFTSPSRSHETLPSNLSLSVGAGSAHISGAKSKSISGSEILQSQAQIITYRCSTK
jgi:hypothetical protein